MRIEYNNDSTIDDHAENSAALLVKSSASQLLIAIDVTIRQICCIQIQPS